MRRQERTIVNRLLVFMVCVVLLGFPAWSPSGSLLAQTTSQQQALDVVLVIDKSSSMLINDPDDLRVAAARLFSELMAADDRVAVVSFARDAELLLGFTSDREAIGRALEQASEGIPELGNPTEMGAGLREAYNLLDNRSESEAQGVAILLTDGRPCPWDGPREDEEAEVRQWADKFEEEGWSIHTVGLCTLELPDDVCDDVKDRESCYICFTCDERLLWNIALTTNGSSHTARSAEELADVYVSLLADIYGLWQMDIKQWEPPRFYVLRDTLTLIAIVEQPNMDLEAMDCPQEGVFEIKPDGPGQLRLPPRKSCLEHFQIARIDDPLPGDWRASALDSARITGLLSRPGVEIRFASPIQGALYRGGEQVAVEAVFLQSDGQVVDDTEWLSTTEIEISVYVNDGFLEAFALTGSEARRGQSYLLPHDAEGKYTFKAGARGWQGASVDIEVVPGPTPTTPIPTTPIPTTAVPPTATDTPVPTPIPTPTPTPFIGLDIPEGGLEMYNDLIASFGLSSSSTKSEEIQAEVKLADSSGQLVPGTEAELKPDEFLQQATIEASLWLTSDQPLPVGEYWGRVTFSSQSGVDVVPESTDLHVSILSPWGKFWKQYGGWITALLILLVASGLVFAAWWLFMRPVVGGGLIVNKLPAGGSIYIKKRKQTVMQDGAYIPLKRLGKRSLSLGSGPSCDIRLTGDEIDSLQAELQVTGWRSRGSKLWIKNRGQTCDTLVEGASVTRQRIYNEERIEMGGYEFENQNPRYPSPFTG